MVTDGDALDDFGELSTLVDVWAFDSDAVREADCVESDAEEDALALLEKD